MIVEMAILEAKPGEADAMREGLTRARDVISQASGYRGSAFHQSIERPERFVLYIQWDSVADHTEGFRKGPLFPQWRAHWAEHMGGTPDTLHYEIFAGEL
jgi:heme-degrading monooxygenase HmoA